MKKILSFFFGYQIAMNLSNKKFGKIDKNLIEPLEKNKEDGDYQKMPLTLVSGIKKILWK